MEGRAELGRRPVRERCSRRCVVPSANGDGPELQVHLRRRVERQAPQHGPHLVVARYTAEQPRGEKVRNQPGANMATSPGNMRGGVVMSSPSKASSLSTGVVSGPGSRVPIAP